MDEWSGGGREMCEGTWTARKVGGRGREIGEEQRCSKKDQGNQAPNWYLNTCAAPNCCYHKKLMN